MQCTGPNVIVFLINKLMPQSVNLEITRPGGYKTFFMLNLTEHEISTNAAK